MSRRNFALPMTAAILVLWTNIAATAAYDLQEIELFRSGQDGYHTYRIPSLLVTPKGTVLAFCEGRKTGSGDHGDVDLVMKRSNDGGRKWSSQSVVYEEGRDAKITIGNPCPVVDAAAGRIWLPFCRNNKQVFITYSSDEGQTWRKPVDISATTTRPEWAWVATGPGIGIQLQRGPQRGRLVIPCDHRIDHPDAEPEWNSHMMYSDDSGKTWQISHPIEAGGNECQVIERTNGSLLVNTRIQGGFRRLRGTAFSYDSGVMWSVIRYERQLPDVKCQASLIRYSEPTATSPGWLLFSNPRPTIRATGERVSTRQDLTVQGSPDDGATWPVSRTLHYGPAAYSCLGRLADGTILCLYEGGMPSAYQAIRLARFPLEWLTAGK